jgi:hypothetical protein
MVAPSHLCCDLLCAPPCLQVPQLCKMLRGLLQAGFSPEHDVGGITDPFLQASSSTQAAWPGLWWGWGCSLRGACDAIPLHVGPRAPEHLRVSSLP